MIKQRVFKQAGFSLAELLVALTFISLLMAGMAKIFSSSMQTFSASNEILGAQRANRWALDLLSDDLSQAGFVFPERALPSHILNGAEPLFSITPDQAVPGLMRRSDTKPGEVEGESLNADVLQFFTDVPLMVRAKLKTALTGEGVNPDGTATTASTAADLDYDLGGVNKLRGGDVMVILDSGEYGSWETPLVKGALGSTVASEEFETDPTRLATYSLIPKSPGIALAHPVGVEVSFVRPAQLIRYAVEAVALDPSEGRVKVPCLVRRQIYYPTSGAAVWTGANVESQIIAENVDDFNVTISFDGGKTWNPTTTKTGDWFRDESCLLRLDVTTRTAMRRAEYSANNDQLAYRRRTQTLMISPRNFGYGR